MGLDRFVDAQDRVWASVLDELRSGEKKTHWMWFVFPQLRGLGLSPTSNFFGIAGVPEAEDYLRHPKLGPRLEQTTNVTLELEGRKAETIFGNVDALKFRSSLTLFAHVAESGSPYQVALDKFFFGIPDPRTIDLLRRN